MRLAPPIGRPVSSAVRRGILTAEWNASQAYSASTVLLPQITVTAHATPHTMGAWTEVVAAVPYDVGGIDLVAYGAYSSGNSARSLLDIGIGAAGSEVALVSSIDVGQALYLNTIGATFPVFIANGTRISLAIQSVIGGQTGTVIVRLHPYAPIDGVVQPRAPVTYGANRADSTGVILVPGAAAAKGAWTEIVTATTQPLVGIVPLVGCGAYGNTLNRYGLVDVAVGAAGSERIIVENLHWSVSNAEVFYYHSGRVVPVELPAGVRLSARTSVQTATYGPSIILLAIPPV